MTHAYQGSLNAGGAYPIKSRPSKAARGSTTDKLGGRLIVTASLIAAVLVVLAVVYAAAPRPSGAAAPAGADAKLTALARRYLAIANPANHRLEVANDGYNANERDNLAAATSDLRAEVATETLFDRQLAEIPLPPRIAAIARALIQANQQRGALTVRQARSTSLAQLRSFDQRHRASDAAVEVDVRLIRKALHLPPPSTS
jgi:hypothetical protein